MKTSKKVTVSAIIHVDAELLRYMGPELTLAARDVGGPILVTRAAPDKSHAN